MQLHHDFNASSTSSLDFAQRPEGGSQTRWNDPANCTEPNSPIPAMPDLVAKKVGGKVVMVSSLDEQHPGDNMIDGREDSYWISTGLYPQEILLQLGQRAAVSSVKISTTNVRGIRASASSNYTNRPKQFTLRWVGFWTTKLHKVTKNAYYCSNNTQVAVTASKCHRALHVNRLLGSLRAFVFLCCGDLRNRRLCWGGPCELPDVGRGWVGRGTWQDAGEGHSMPYRRNGIHQDHDPLRLPWLLHSSPGDCRVSAACCRTDSWMYGAAPLTRSGSTLLEFIAQHVKAEQKKSSLHTFAFVLISEITWTITNGDFTAFRTFLCLSCWLVAQTGRPVGDQEGTSGRMGCNFAAFVWWVLFINHMFAMSKHMARHHEWLVVHKPVCLSRWLEKCMVLACFPPMILRHWETCLCVWMSNSLGLVPLRTQQGLNLIKALHVGMYGMYGMWLCSIPFPCPL